MKKQLLILMTLCISILGYSQAVGDTFIDNFITYEVTSISPYEVKVADYDHSGSTDVVILATVTNSGTAYNITSIGDDAFNYNGPTGKITSATFTLPSNITTIGVYAFRDQNLTTVTIPSSIISISQYAFWHNDLTSVTIQDGVENIDANAFSANQLSDIIIPNSVINIGQAAFQANQLTSAILSNSLTNIEGSVFQSNQLQSIVIPNSVTSISGAAFGTNQLTSLTLSNNLTFIGAGAFRSNNLTHVTIPSTVTNIENSAFRDNFNLATVTSQAITPPTIYIPDINDTFYNRSAIDLTIPSGTSAAYAAGGWTGFQSITEASALAVGDTFVVDFITYEVTSLTPNEVKTIDYNTNGGAVVTIPDSVNNNTVTYNVASVGAASFFDKQLTSVTIGNNVVSFGQSAFRQNQLTNVVIPDNVTGIGFYSFLNNQLTDIDFGTGLTSIPEQSLQNNQFVSITIPDNITEIGWRAFDGNNQLTCMVVESTVPPTIFTGTGDSINNRANINLTIPAGTGSAYAAATWTGFNSVSEGFGNIFVVDNISYVINSGPNNEVSILDYNTAGGAIVNIPGSVVNSCTSYSVTAIAISAFENKGLTQVTMPNSITTIGVEAFRDNLLTNVIMSDNTSVIGVRAFLNNQLSNVTIPDSVTSIGSSAFGSNALQSINIPNNVISIGANAFASNQLTNVILGNSLATIENQAFLNNSITSIVIPDSVTSFGERAFQSNQLTSVTISNNVTSIGEDSFRFNQIANVVIPDGVTSIGDDAFSGNQITSVTFPNSLTSISKGAFENNQLAVVIIPENVTAMGTRVFAQNPLTDVYSEALIPSNITTSGVLDTFNQIRNTIHLHIPAGTMGAYVTDSGALWTGFNPVTEDALSVSEFELANQVTVITTPNELQVISANFIELNNYTLYTISGVKVATGTESKISTSSFANGIYVLKLDFDRGSISKKIVVN